MNKPMMSIGNVEITADAVAYPHWRFRSQMKLAIKTGSVRVLMVAS